MHGLAGLLVITAIVVQCRRARYGHGRALAMLAALQLALGVAVAVGHYPIALGTAHNAATALLVLLLASVSDQGDTA